MARTTSERLFQYLYSTAPRPPQDSSSTTPPLAGTFVPRGTSVPRGHRSALARRRTDHVPPPPPPYTTLPLLHKQLTQCQACVRSTGRCRVLLFEVHLTFRRCMIELSSCVGDFTLGGRTVGWGSMLRLTADWTICVFIGCRLSSTQPPPPDKIRTFPIALLISVKRVVVVY